MELFWEVYAGFVSELLLKQKGTPRPLMNVFALLLSCLGVLMATVIIGFSYGAQVTLLCTITSEIFGLKYYATLVNCTQFATPLGWFLLDNKLTQPMYHLEAKRLNMGRQWEPCLQRNDMFQRFFYDCGGCLGFRSSSILCFGQANSKVLQGWRV